MGVVSSTSGLQDITQAALQQLKLQQARQNADRAERVARSLQRQAAEAQREADRAQDNARDLSVLSHRAQGEAGRARQGLAMVRSADAMKVDLSTRLTQVEASANKTGTGSTTPVVEKPSAPVINTSGQMTGTVINAVV